MGLRMIRRLYNLSSTLNFNQVFVPAGGYKSIRTINITTYLRLYGAGQNSGINFINCSGFFCKTDILTIEQLTISTNATDANNNYTGFHIEKGWTRMRDIAVTGNWKIGIRCVDLIKSCLDKVRVETDNTLGFDTVGIYGDHSVNISLVSCIVQGYSKSIYIRDLISPANHYNEGWMITNCLTIICNYGLYIERVLHLAAVNNIFDFNEINGIYMRSNTSVKIESNWIASSVTPNFIAIKADSSSSSSFTNNTLTISGGVPNPKDFQLDGIDNVVSGNTTRSLIGGTITGSNSVYGNVGSQLVIVGSAITRLFGKIGINIETPTSPLQVANIQEYNDNISAKNAGLTNGAFYRTGEVLKIVF